MKSLVFCMTVVMAVFALPVMTQVSALPQTQELQWPQSFDLEGPHMSYLRFAVTGPGVVVVTVQVQGAAVVASVRGPLPNPLPPVVPQSAQGMLRFTYNLSPQDVQRGILWEIQLQLAQPGAQPPGHARGSINLQRPPVDEALVQQVLKAQLAQRHIATAQERALAAAQTKAQMDAAFNARKMDFAQRNARRRAEAMHALQPALDELRRQKAALAAQTTTPASDQIHTRAIPPQWQHAPLPPPPPAPNPSITSLTINNAHDDIPLPAGSYGQPGDPVAITGTNFGNDGEVHFVIGPLPTQDIAVAPSVWTDKEIWAPIPIVSGVPPYPGLVYIKRHADAIKSNAVTFQFEPDVEQREIRVMADSVLNPTGRPRVGG